MEPPNEQRVLSALRTVFVGQKAQLRAKKKVKNCIKENKSKVPVQSLLALYSLKDVCMVAGALLHKGKFESTQPTSANPPNPSTQASKPPAANMSAEQVQKISSSTAVVKSAPTQETLATNPSVPTQVISTTNASSSASSASSTNPNGLHHGPQPKATEHTNPPTKPQTDSTSIRSSVRSTPEKRKPGQTTLSNLDIERRIVTLSRLEPIHLPLPTQHRLLRRVQKVLESSCFAFALVEQPEVLREKGWDYPESVELNIWSHLFSSSKGSILRRKSSTLGKPLTSILASMSEIRHSAVHRLDVPIDKIVNFLSDAESLVEIFEHPDAQYELAHLRRSTEQAAETVHRYRDLLRSRAMESLRGFAAQKEAIERLEQAAIKVQLDEAKTHLSVVGKSLEQTAFVVAPSLTNVAVAAHVPNGEEGEIRETYFDAEEFA